MTNQEIFDKVVTHLRTQGVPAVDNNEMCVYRGPNGTMCAVGCLIPDELYDFKIETGSVKDASHINDYSTNCVIRLREVLETIFDVVPYDLLSELQDAHDEWAWHGSLCYNLENSFKLIANEFYLTYHPPDMV